jgi:hypothetical protein
MKTILILLTCVIGLVIPAHAAGPAAFWGPAAAPSGGGYNPYVRGACPINAPNCNRAPKATQRAIKRRH